MMYIKFTGGSYGEEQDGIYSIWELNDNYEERPIYYSDVRLGTASKEWHPYDEERCEYDLQDGYELTVLTKEEAFLEMI